MFPEQQQRRVDKDKRKTQMANVQTDVPAAVEKTRKLIDGEHTVDELVSIIKKQQFGEEGLIRDWGKKTELERLVEAEREKQEKKRLKREAKARRKEMASESKLSADERKKLEKVRMKAIEREEKAAAAAKKAEESRLASFV